MLTPATRHRVVAVLLAVTVSGCLAGLAADYVGRQARRHVVVTLSNVNDAAQVFVNCRLAGTVLTPGKAGKTFDLGWFRPDDLVTLQARNITGDYAWGFAVVVDGKERLNDHKGTVGQDAADGGAVAHQHGITHVRTVTAGGRSVARAGCQEAQPALDGAISSHPRTFRATGSILGTLRDTVPTLQGLLVLIGGLGAAWWWWTDKPLRRVAALPVVAAFFALQQGRYGLFALCLAIAAVFFTVAYVLSAFRTGAGRPPPPGPGDGPPGAPPPADRPSGGTDSGASTQTTARTRSRRTTNRPRASAPRR
ncbi:MAG: hypothetical protein QOE65_1147 [Solirubrobacteraceae bacterium]|jgi:hypothetical protein|nr:hypothetical protein [Solirubrobacteraceae bacterium]